MKTKIKIYDSVHGFIRFNELEALLVDSFPFQRLHYIHQLGISYLVYPGGTHSRFEHSIGVMEVATMIFDKIAPDCPPEEETDYWRQIVRLGALCHDLGHLPFSHVAEKELLGKEGHEQWTLNIIQSHYLAPLWQKLQETTKRAAIEDVIKVAIGEHKLSEMAVSLTFTPWERLVAEIVAGDFFGADRIDYLLRDAQSTGVAYGLIDHEQLIEMLRIIPWKGQLALGIEEDGIESCEALLLARHFMRRRVYLYESGQAYSFHLKRFMKHFYEKHDLNNLENYLWTTDNEILSALSVAARKGDPDAAAIFTRHHRFKAVQIVKPMTEKDLLKIKKELSIPDGSFEWEMHQKYSKKVGFSFPILKKDGSIIDGEGCSTFLIPSNPIGWVFVAPDYVSAVRKALI